ncbi:MAG: hypothetical protein K5931_09810 [Lachnospiraceae bacterium]|nr:hypothetical protein [Lachnospiraceae bacterium]
MRNLFRADLGRILKVPVIYVASVLSLIVILFEMMDELINKGENATAYISGFTSSLSAPYLALFITVPFFYAVFSNELSSKSMQCIIGRGLSRDKLIITKFLDVAVLLGFLYIFITMLCLLFADASYGISDRQMYNLLIFIWMRALRYFGYIVFSAMVMYLTSSTAAGMVTSIAFALIFKIIFVLMEELFGVTIYDYTFDGMLDWAYSSIETGAFPWQFIPAIAYLLAGLFITVFFFRRKEFEF